MNPAKYTYLDNSDIAWLHQNSHLLPRMSAGRSKRLSYLASDAMDSIGSTRGPSDVYVGGQFEIQVAHTRSMVGGPAFPHLQWIHGKRGQSGRQTSAV